MEERRPDNVPPRIMILILHVEVSVGGGHVARRLSDRFNKHDVMLLGMRLAIHTEKQPQTEPRSSCARFGSSFARLMASARFL